MKQNERASVNEQISQEAAEWLVEFRTGEVDTAGRRDFDDWLRTSPQHIRAFIEMAALWHKGEAIDPRRQLDVDKIIASAHRERNIVGLAPATVAPTAAFMIPAARGNAGNRRSPVGWQAGAILFIAVVAGALVMASRLSGHPTYTAGVGAPRSVVLPDGTRVVLDSGSRLRVAFTAAARTVDLLQGQALFSVVRNPNRPFRVHVGDTIIRDVGTKFDVNRLQESTIVTVVEGRVAITVPAAAAHASDTATLPEVPPNNRDAPMGAYRVPATTPINLSAGEQLAVRQGYLSPRPVHVDISSVTAWAHGEVVLESATLSEVAQIFSRYTTRRLIAHDLGKEPLRLSGVFAANPDFLIRYLRNRPDVLITERHSEIDIVRTPNK